MFNIILKSITILLPTLFIAESANAQFLQRVRDRAQDALEKSVERKIEEEVGKKIDFLAEKAVDETFDLIFGSIGATSDNSSDGSTGNRRGRQSSANYMKRFTDVSTVKTESEYKFGIITTLEMETIKGNGESDGKMNMVFHYNENAEYTGTRITSDDLTEAGSDAIIIYDYKNEVMVMMMSTEDSKFSIAYNWTETLKDMDGQMEHSQVSQNNVTGVVPASEINTGISYSAVPNFERLGTRTIGGYSNEGYRTENEHSVTEIWVTNEIAFGMNRMFEANRSMPAVGNNLPGVYPSGMIMEMTSIDKESGGKFIMRTTDVNKNSNVVFSMADYPVMSFSSDK